MSPSRKKKSALTVEAGIPPPESVSSEAVDRLKRARKKISVTALLEGILNRDVSLLSQAITLVESTHPRHLNEAQELIASALPYSGKAFRVGITGIPGAGKSTFIEALGLHVTGKGGRLAVLAVDPSSGRSGGSILGDKTRMEKLAADPNAFIRPSPAGSTLGGVARKTRESIILCEAAGFDHIFVETVGVGQSETSVHGMVDFFLLIALAGTGDELQGIKRGIMELADGIVINKADGDNLQNARKAGEIFARALHLFPPSPSGWIPEVRSCSSLNNQGITGTWQMVEKYRKLVTESGFLQQRRKEQSSYWMYESIREGIFRQLLEDPGMKQELETLKRAIEEGRMSPFRAATEILEKFRTKKN